MTDNSPAQSIFVPLFTSVFTAVLTLLGTSWQLASQNTRADNERFVDNAQATVIETNRLLDDGYDALNNLLEAADGKDWAEFSKSSWRDYLAFHRRWRQQLIIEHFKMARYFGKDIADQLIHVDEIDMHPIRSLGSPEPCTPAGDKTDFDVEKLAFQLECTATEITTIEDMIRKPIGDDRGAEIIKSIEAKRDTQDFAYKLLDQYDKSTVSVMRLLDDRLTQLGAPKVTSVVGKPKT